MLEQIHAGSGNPLAVDCILCSGGDFPVGFEASEVVDPDDVDQLEGHFHALSPPDVVVFLVHGPVVDGVAPELAEGGECIRRAACLCRLVSLRIDLEEPWVGPGIHAVACDIDGDIADDLDSESVGILVEAVPLCEEEELQDLVDLDLRCKGLSPLGQHGLLSGLEAVFPQVPARVVEVVHQSLIEGVVVKPPGVFRAEGLVGVLGALGIDEKLCSFLQKRHLVLVNPRVVDTSGGPVFKVLIGLSDAEHPVQGPEVDQQLIACECGAGSVGAVAEAGWPERQNLPEADLCLRQHHEYFTCFLSEIPDSERRGERCGMYENAAASRIKFFLHLVPSVQLHQSDTITYAELFFYNPCCSDPILGL